MQRAAIWMFCTCKLALVRQDQNQPKTNVSTCGGGAKAFDLRPYGNLGKMKRSPGFQNVYLSYICQVRVENVKDAACHIPVVLERVKREYIAKTYKVSSWTDSTDFLEQVAQRTGKLLKGGEADVNTVGKMILNDFQRGKLPYFVPPPPKEGDEETQEKGKNDRNDQKTSLISFVKETATESNDRHSETDKAAKEQATVHELTVKDGNLLGGEENKTLSDSTAEAKPTELPSYENDAGGEENRTLELTPKAKPAEILSQPTDAKEDSISATETTTENGCSEDTVNDKNTEKKTNPPHVKQNFSEINVGPEYTGDDVQPLEENSDGEEDISVSESESDDESENDDVDMGRDEKNDEQDDIRAAYGKPDHTE